MLTIIYFEKVSEMIVEYQIFETEVYTKWFASLKDEKVKARIDKRIERIKYGNFGDAKILGNGISELRLQFGSGYRIYYMQHRQKIVILLCAGDKSTQENDIKKAKQLAGEV